MANQDGNSLSLWIQYIIIILLVILTNTFKKIQHCFIQNPKTYKRIRRTAAHG